MSAKTQAEALLKKAGITINGPNDFDLQIKNEKVYAWVLRGGSLNLGESYMDGWWEVKRLDQFFAKILSGLSRGDFAISFADIAMFLRFKISNVATPAKSFKVGEQHYDAGNDLYQAMLDKRMVYTCGYWKDAKTLDEAQEAKLDLVCKKLGLKKGERVLDIGCGWGSFLKFAAEKYGIIGVGVTISKEQVALAKKLCEGLPIEIILEDYRSITGSFDHIVSLGMFEHVNVKNYRRYFQKAHELLKDDGLFLLHTIGSNSSRFTVDPWIEKYIFPNSMLPSAAHIAKATEGLFIMEDWHNFGPDYDKTLLAWFDNFDKAWPKLSEKYPETFYRMWKYYLMVCAANFRVRSFQLWQVVLSKKGVPGGYVSVR